MIEEVANGDPLSKMVLAATLAGREARPFLILPLTAPLLAGAVAMLATK